MVPRGKLAIPTIQNRWDAICLRLSGLWVTSFAGTITCHKFNVSLFPIPRNVFFLPLLPLFFFFFFDSYSSCNFPLLLSLVVQVVDALERHHGSRGLVRSNIGIIISCPDDHGLATEFPNEITAPVGESIFVGNLRFWICRGSQRPPVSGGPRTAGTSSKHIQGCPFVLQCGGLGAFLLWHQSLRDLPSFIMPNLRGCLDINFFFFIKSKFLPLNITISKILHKS